MTIQMGSVDPYADEAIAERSLRGGLGRRLRASGPVIAAFIIFMVLWKGSILLLHIPQYLLPSPEQIVAQLLQPGLFARHAMITLIEALFGFVIGSIVGFVIAVILDTSELLERGVLPYLIASTNIPIVALAPVIVLWFGFGMESKIAVAAFLSFFPVVIYTLKGLKSADPVLRDLFYSNTASRRQTFWKLRLPNAMPYIFTALRVGATASVLAAVVAEFIQSSEGIGYLILSSSYNNNITRVWASVVVTSAIAIAFYSLVVLVERWAIPWHASMRKDER